MPGVRSRRNSVDRGEFDVAEEKESKRQGRAEEVVRDSKRQGSRAHSELRRSKTEEHNSNSSSNSNGGGGGGGGGIEERASKITITDDAVCFLWNFVIQCF
jgi:hypothetical protein